MRRRFALSLFYCQLLCAPAAFSQRSATSFGPLSDLYVGYRPSGVVVGQSDPPRIEIAVLAPEQPSINLYRMSASGLIGQTGALKTQKAFRCLVATDLNDDGTSEFICLSIAGNSVSIIKRFMGSTFEEREVSLPTPAQKCVAADLNNDKRKDILLFGKNSAGVQTLLGQPNGTFKLGPVLFSDISISDLSVLDINADGIADILTLNWLSNQLTVFYGIGRLVYTEQVAVQLPSEPSDLDVSSVSNQQSFRVAVTLPEVNRIQVYSGNSLGDYRLMNTLALDARPAGILFVQINSDGMPDLITSTNKGIAVALGTSSTTFMQPVVFGAAQSISSWTVADVDGDGKSDCVLVDQNTKRLIVLANAEFNAKNESPEYSVGTSPEGLVVADFYDSGRNDIGVVNAESSTLSILRNRGKGRFSGQVSLQLTGKPTYVKLASTPAMKEKTLITSHPDEDKVTVISLDDDVQRSKTFSVPTGGDPFVLLGKQELSKLRFLVRYRGTRDKSFLLSSFEQINQRQFIERSLRSTLPTRIVAMNVDEGLTPGSYEVLFATNDKMTKQTTVWLGVSESGLELKTTKQLFSYADSTVSTKFILGGFANGDSYKDVVVSLGTPRNQLCIWYGKAPEAIRDSVEWIHNVQPTSEDAVIMKDVNGDGAPDITLLDGLRQAVVTLYGTERNGFNPPTFIATAEGVHSIRVAALRDNSAHDLVMSHTARGTISVLLDPFHR